MLIATWLAWCQDLTLDHDPSQGHFKRKSRKMFQSNWPVENRERSIRKEEDSTKAGGGADFLCCMVPSTCSSWSSVESFSRVHYRKLFCWQAWHLFPACGHRLYLFRSCLRERALKAQQSVFTGSSASSTSQQIFICESLYEHLYKWRGGISPSFSGKDNEDWNGSFRK